MNAIYLYIVYIQKSSAVVGLGGKAICEKSV